MIAHKFLQTANNDSISILLDKDQRENSARVHIRGESRDVEEAKRFVEEFVSNGNSGRDRHSDESRYDKRTQNTERERDSRYNQSEQLEIDPSKVGFVIGRGGGKIREIQEKFNVNLNIGTET